MLSIRTLIVQATASILLTSSLVMADAAPSAKVELSVPQASKETQEPDIQKLSLAFGNFIGKNLKGPGVNFDLEALITGIREGALGKPSPMSEEEYEDALTAMQEKAFMDVSYQNLAQANSFLEKNSQEKNIVQVQEGKLQYEVLAVGNGPVVTEHSVPQINYVGKFMDGTVFGSSEETGAVEIPLDQTIPGFSQGLIGMKEGEKRRLYIHPDLGYGTSGPLPPNSLLIFDIEIVKSDISNATPEAEEVKDVTLGAVGKEINKMEKDRDFVTSIAIGTPIDAAEVLPNSAEEKVHTQVQEAPKEAQELKRT